MKTVLELKENHLNLVFDSPFFVIQICKRYSNKLFSSLTIVIFVLVVWKLKGSESLWGYNKEYSVVNLKKWRFLSFDSLCMKLSLEVKHLNLKIWNEKISVISCALETPRMCFGNPNYRNWGKEALFWFPDGKYSVFQ